jgi:hypothetical protein
MHRLTVFVTFIWIIYNFSIVFFVVQNDHYNYEKKLGQ